jgi:3',5'-cyclic-AMP phosphodiesterase
VRSRLIDAAGARLAGFTVFAVEDTSIQLCWSQLDANEVAIEIGEQRFEVGASPPAWFRRRWRRPWPPALAGPGGLVVEGLSPDTEYEIRVDGRVTATARTLPALDGRLLYRFATVSDCHIGEPYIGPFHVLRDPRPLPVGLDPYPVRTLAAALAEAEAWGAQLIVAKGDLTYESECDEATVAARLLATASVPVHALLGNHDVRGDGDVEGVLVSHGVSVDFGVRYVDIPGARLLFGHSPVPGLHSGRLSESHTDELLDVCRDTGGPVVVSLHHPPRRGPIPTYYPPSISWRDSRRLLKGLAAANRRALVLAGHTHRNRRYRVEGVDVAEVGSTKDYPGGWAGYSVYDGGIRQVVRRTLRPDVIPWTETTSRAAGGLWGCWSPGLLEDRCWTIRWE